MKNLRILLAVVLMGALPAWMSLIPRGDLQVKQGKTRPMKTDQWMEGVMKPQTKSLQKGLEAGPKSRREWRSLARSAALLNEASYVLMADGRCPDGVWKTAASKTLRQGSAALLKAIAAKDVAKATRSFEALTQACDSCHKKHRKRRRR